MKTKLFVCLIFACLIVSNTTKAQVDVGDSLALVDLYNSTNGPHWLDHTNWLTKKPVSEWKGIIVKNKNVNQILLQGNRLKGQLPESFGNFDSLVTVFLYSNSLTGSLPVSIGNLSTVKEMEFIDNQLTGEIPSSIGNMTQLTEFVFNGNQLTGNIPATIGNCKYLADIEFYLNELTGPVPASLGNCTKLKTVWLANNKLSGALSSLKKLTKLSSFDASNNFLSGTLEDVFADSLPLGSLILENNRFSGPLPTSLGTFSYLQEMDLSDNKFSGQIPASLGNITPLLDLDVSNNQLSGNVPPILFNLPYLQYIYLDNNQLTEDINPSYNGSLVRFPFSYVQKNRFTFNGLEYLTEKYGGHVAVSPQAELSVHLYKNKLAVSAGGKLSNNTYTWFKVGKGGGNVVVGDSTFTPTESGSYFCTIINRIVTKLTLYTDTVNYTVPLKNELNISLSPNPAKDRITIHGLNEKSNATITIADMSGYTWVKTFSRQQSALAIDVSRLKPGNYLLNVNDGKDVKTIQFVKE